MEGLSMFPTLQDGSTLVLNKAAYARIPFPGDNPYLLGKRFGGPKRGDVVVFTPPDPHANDFVKRIVAVEGDTFEIRDRTLYVNRSPSNTIGDNVDTYPGRAFNFSNGPLTVPKGKVIVMGDNRTVSFDSRAWGYLDVDSIMGTAHLVEFLEPNRQ